MYSDTLKIELQDQILIIGLNRPEKRNALNDEAILALEQVFDQIPLASNAPSFMGKANILVLALTSPPSKNATQHKASTIPACGIESWIKCSLGQSR